MASKGFIRVVRRIRYAGYLRDAGLRVKSVRNTIHPHINDQSCFRGEVVSSGRAHDAFGRRHIGVITPHSDFDVAVGDKDVVGRVEACPRLSLGQIELDPRMGRAGPIRAVVFSPHKYSR